MEKKITQVEICYYALDELDPAEKELVKAARNAQSVSYSPYSRYRVGCAIRLIDGTVICGANQENASYGLALCAERSTVFSIQNSGRGNKIVALAVSALSAIDIPVAPCGSCRQVLKEVEDICRRKIIILMDGTTDKKIARVEGVDNLLPFAFGPKNLGVIL